MNVKLNPLARQISTLHTAHFASSKQNKNVPTTNSDHITFLQKDKNLRLTMLKP